MCIVCHIMTVYIKLQTMSFSLLNLELKIVVCRWKLWVFCLVIVSTKRVIAVHMQVDLKIFSSRTFFSTFSQTTLCVFKLRSHISWCCSLRDCSFQEPSPMFVAVCHLRRILMPLEF